MELRSKKIPFMRTTTNNFEKMMGFTEFTVAKNPKEYSRKYIDEDFERSDIVAYATSASYKFDYEPNNVVHQKIVDITDNEKVGDEAIVTIALVDMTGEPQKDADKEIYPCLVREFVVVPGSEGDDSDVYTYSGTLKAIGNIETGSMAISNEHSGEIIM